MGIELGTIMPLHYCISMYLTKQEVMRLGVGYGCGAVLGEGDSRVMGFIVDSHLTRRIQVVIGAEKILLNIA